MRTTALFFAYLLVCLICAAILSVPLSTLFELEPHRLLGRLTQLFILLGAWPFLKYLQLANKPATGYCLAKPIFRRTMALGWIYGVVILTCLCAMLLALEVRIPDPEPPTWLQILAKVLHALMGGLLIALWEETFFRGALYTASRRRTGFWTAAIWGSLLYAIVHFIDPSEVPDNTPHDWSSAAWMVVDCLINLFQWQHLDSLVALTLVGIFLCMVRERTGHIGWCIGLHAGWVFVIQVSRKLTDGNELGTWAWLAGDYDGTIGWLAAAWIGLLATLYWIYGLRVTQDPSTTPPLNR